MTTTTIGVVHPGAMGAVVAGLLPPTVLWAGAGRSEATRARAAAAGLVDAGTVAELADRADLILSLCPPAAALATADAVAAAGFDGLYVDANAVSPDTARSVASRFDRFVDGGVIGPPPTVAGTSRLYLSGAEAATVAGLFAGTRLEAVVVDGGPGAASALKVAYAAWTKGSAALLLAVRTLAGAEGVADGLEAEWVRSQPGLVDRVAAVAADTGPKAWRFVGEMEEIAATFATAGLPTGFHDAAAEIYRRLAPLRGADRPAPDSAIELILGDPQ